MWREEISASGCGYAPLLGQGLVLLCAAAAAHRVKGQYGGFMPFFPIRTNELVAKLFGSRVCFFCFCPSTGKELRGPVLQGRWTTCCCNNTWCSHKCPSWFQRSLKTVIDAYAIIKILQVHSLESQEPDSGEDKSDATNREGEKNTFRLSIYLSIHRHIYCFSLWDSQNFK